MGSDKQSDGASHDPTGRDGGREDGEVKPYHGPAGGWGAVGASAKFIAKSKAVGRSLKSLLRVNQPDGFDCPGCAWPEPRNPGRFEFCENGVKAVTWETTGKRVTPAFFAEHSVSELRGKDHHWLESQGRLTQPMRYNRATDHYEPIGWDDAFALIGDRLRSLASPNEAIFYTSGRTSNEAAFLWQLFARAFGTNNLPDCSNMCHESSGFALGEQIGVGKGTVTISDFEQADAIFVIGQNPGTNHPRMLTELQKAAERGCRIVAINPLREPGLERFAHPQRPMQMMTGGSTELSTLYLQPVVGGDLATMKGIIKWVLEREEADAQRNDDEAAQRGDAGGARRGVDQTFIREHTVGFDAFKDDVAGTAWQEIQAQSGLSRDEIGEAAEVYRKADSVICCWAMGLTQQKHAVATIQMVVNLLLLGGHIGRPGGGACPVRGHSNVQGDRTMGITPRPKPALLDGLRHVFKFDPPREPGLDTVAAIEAMADGRASVFLAMGGNFAAASPDSDFTEAALAKCKLTAHVATKLNRSHLVTGRDALILPCLGRSERDAQQRGPQKVTVEDSMSMVHASEGKNEPASPHLLSEPAIVAGIASATLASDAAPTIDWNHLVADYSRIRDTIAQTLPALFHDYNIRIENPGGFYLGNAARDRKWKTDVGKAKFMTHAIPDQSLPSGQLRLMTVRSHDQYNTTVYGMQDRYRGVSGTRHVIFMNALDLRERKLRDGDSVDITSHADDGSTRTVRGFRAVEYDIPRGCAAGYFPEMNPLVSVTSFADGSRTPLSKFVPVTISTVG